MLQRGVFTLLPHGLRFGLEVHHMKKKGGTGAGKSGMELKETKRKGVSCMMTRRLLEFMAQAVFKA
jgi:hypothetical protein